MSDNFKKITLCITGSNGFVGNALGKLALDRGYQVRAATRAPKVFQTGIKNILLPSFNGGLLNNSHAMQVLTHALSEVDVLIHLAARVHVMQESATDSLGAYRDVNVGGTIALAKAAIDAGVKRFIYLSSIKVNGEATPLGQPFTANQTPAPEDPYGVSKLEAELALQALAKSSGLELVIIRPPLIYGPGVGANFAGMMKVLTFQVPLPLGAIDNRRSMVGLDNLNDLILTCAEKPEAKGQTFLVSDDQDVSLSDLLRKLIAIMKVRTLLVPIPVSLLRFMAQVIGKGDVAQRLCDSLQVDIRKTKDILGWEPLFTLDQGLQKTVRWYEKK